MGIATEQIRQRAIAAYENGCGTQAEIARFYGIDLSTFQRWLRRYRQSGQTAPLARGHNPAALDIDEMAQLARLIDTTPDATLDQLRQALRKECSLVAIHNALKRLNYRYKKNATGRRTRTRRRKTTS